ncbi:MAG: aspartate aminotransferase [Zetaproteobacteria bacterium CG12_big_fil_rev_8_21_14_0_65_55_1124]|nr:MAG: aspartate aminotransferase [Zetaproteobacteria bacterium CG1_02_55_237]PIS18338.1 MAG: aspartate aminotransferase [Zetaproteobacteria bacterium CG08_land_8_20_14_0_20_55_17]PIW43069.1 MAG: aspartate aminotransferase [Zetaproteobacteria bacterium CG12_big_fil_rev_8_21_14_0_65_55_1124]PIY52278.1 MAG: aspartate aminotransferase [Zetaproteobacteria bacterium CG_4_10_14_0_8_um_filter_55_43]PIZ38770.1 MAG: aspartate aminotransferase [Zetaproteobacteria bacterium CG_4_10_14_0_2_um_filter_55_20
MIKLSDRVNLVKPSATLTITAKAAELRAAGKNIISLSVGEPDFDTPKAACDAAKAAIDAGFTRYTAVPGIPELRKAIAAKFKKDNDLDYEADDILVSTGGKQCIYNMLQAMINPGDEVIIPAPFWVSYPDMVLLAGGVPVIVDTTAENGFKLSGPQLEAAITPKTKLLFLNSPSNPTGMAYSHDDLAALGAVLKKHENVAVATDDMYEKILFDGKTFATIAQVCPDVKDRTITLNGVSKAYCMTGWRIGFCAGPRHLIKAMAKIQGQSTSNPSSIAQKAALAALTGPTDALEEMVRVYEGRRTWLVAALNKIPGVTCIMPDGAFYVFPSVQAWLGKKTPAGVVLKDDLDVCAWLLEDAGVALVPGTEFGAPGFMRISYAVAQATLEDAVGRIAKAAESLS